MPPSRHFSHSPEKNYFLLFSSQKRGILNSFFYFLAGGGDPDGGTNLTAGDWVMMPKRELVDSTKNLTNSEKTRPNLKNAKLWLQTTV